MIEKIAAYPPPEVAAGDAVGDPLLLGQFFRRQRRPEIPMVLPVRPQHLPPSARTRWISRRTWRVVTPSISVASRCHRALPVALRITGIRFYSVTFIRTVLSLTMLPSQ